MLPEPPDEVVLFFHDVLGRQEQYHHHTRSRKGRQHAFQDNGDGRRAFPLFRQYNGGQCQDGKADIEDQVLRPAQLFDDSPAGTGDKIAVIEYQVDVCRKGDHQEEGGIQAGEPGAFEA
ncbi:hypothetical protein SDC9_115028 [bioreactor metagenome]|uniref:Uncharacterized protein n=1 Tax=bioreactor metagenome TaxID=1076179 RepID=A0A645BS89_9ZZZZ